MILYVYIYILSLSDFAIFIVAPSSTIAWICDIDMQIHPFSLQHDPQLLHRLSIIYVGLEGKCQSAIMYQQHMFDPYEFHQHP